MEGEWRATQNPARQIDVEDTVCFMLLGFGGSEERKFPWLTWRVY